MTEIKVGSIFACDCDVSDVPYFVIAYRNQFPNSPISTNDSLVDWFDNKNRFMVHLEKGKDRIFNFRIVDGKYVYVLPNANKFTHKSNGIPLS